MKFSSELAVKIYVRPFDLTYKNMLKNNGVYEAKDHSNTYIVVLKNTVLYVDDHSFEAAIESVWEDTMFRESHASKVTLRIE